MIVSVHLADLGPRAVPGVLRGKPEPAAIPGLRYAETTITAPLGERAAALADGPGGSG